MWLLADQEAVLFQQFIFNELWKTLWAVSVLFIWVAGLSSFKYH
jgi:hypothetical protein